MQNEIYWKILAQAFRFVLRGAAGYLAYIGVNRDDQTTFIEVTVGILTPLLILAITEGWSFLTTRWQLAVTETARVSPAHTSIEDIKIKAAENTTNVSY